MVGNQMVPFIYEDFISHDTLTKAFMKMYDYGPEKRKEIGQRAAERAKKEYDINKMVGDWDRTLTDIINKWQDPNYDRGLWKVTEL
jgi:hypothetical protein